MGKGRQRGMKEPGAEEVGEISESRRRVGGRRCPNSPGRPQVEAPPLRGSAPFPGPAGRICPEPTSKGPRKLEQAPKEAAQPLTQLWGWGKPRNYGGGSSSHSAPLQMRGPIFKFLLLPQTASKFREENSAKLLGRQVHPKNLT